MGDWSILCDFDGTIAIEDATDTLLDRFAHPDWQKLECEWREGRIGSAECMAGQVALLEASREEIDAHLSGLRIDPAFPAFVEAAREAGLHLVVVSDGLDYVINRILRRYLLDALPVRANRLVQEGPRSWRMEAPFSDANCRIASAHCKCASVMRAHEGHRRVLLIGDGVSDFCVASEADFVFAKHRLIEHCRHGGIPHVSIIGFADAMGLLPALLSGRLQAARFGTPLQTAPSQSVFSEP